MGRLVGVDVRADGSGNVGATNVARTAGRSAGLVTLVIDIAKGAIPVWCAHAVGASSMVVALAGLAAFCGHLWSVFSGFRGGKGVATAAGVFLVLAPASLLISALAFAAVYAIARIVSLASLTAVTLLPAVIAFRGSGGSVLWLSLAIALIVWVAHRENVGRLLAGTEGRFHPKV